MGRLLVVALCLASAWGFAGNIDPIDYPGYDLHHEPDSPDRLTFAGLKAWITEKQITDVDSLLASWEADSHRWQILQSFTLLYDSQSLQRTSVDPAHPRILFHKDGLVGAMVGNVDKPSYRQMELIEFEPDAHRWAFHSVDFPEHAGEPVLYDQNLKRCTACHGDKPRPIWGSYPLWPGAFMSSGSQMSRKEGEYWDAFKSHLKEPAMRRYRFFVKDDSSLHSEANLEMSVHLSWMNYNRMLGELKQSPAFEAYRYAIYGGVLEGCGGIETFLPEKILKAHEAKLGMSLAQSIADTKAQSRAEFKGRIQRYAQLNGGAGISEGDDFDASYAEQVARVRFIVEGQTLDAALDMKPWALSYEPGSYSYNFSTGIHGFTDFNTREIVPYMHSIGVPGSDFNADCADLRKRSLDALEKL